MTKKQKRFIEEYLIDLNATQAAIRAGYSPDIASLLSFLAYWCYSICKIQMQDT